MLRHLKKIIGNKKLLFSFFFIAAAFFLVASPLLHDGFFPTFDDVQVTRIEEMAKELKGGQFPVRYVGTFGNGGGYMLFHMYPPMIYYEGALLVLAGLDPIKATKIMFLASYLLATIGMVVLLKSYVGWIPTVIGTVLFLLSPSLNYEIYTRGTLSEFAAFALLPFFLWAVFEGILKEKKNMILLSGFLLALILVTHTFPGIIAGMCVLLLLFFPHYSKKKSISLISMLLVGACLSAFYWLPLFVEKEYTIYNTSYFGTESYKTNFLHPLQVFQLQEIPWTFKPPLLGLGLAIGTLLFAVILFLRKKKKQETTILALFSLGIILLSLFFVSNSSQFLWESSTFLRNLQFPWRFLIPATLFCVLIISLGIHALKNKYLQIFLGILLILPSVTITYSYLHPETYNFISKYYAEDPCSTTTWNNEYLPQSVKQCLPKSKSRQTYRNYPVVKTKNNVKNLQVLDNNRKVAFSIDGKGGQVLVSNYHFPGWEVFVDGSLVKSSPFGKYGIISFTVPSGNHTVLLTFTNTPIRTIGNTISLISLLGLCFLMYFRWKRKKPVN